MSTADQLISATVCCPRGLISVTCKRLRGKKPSFGPEIFGVIGEHD